MNVRSIGATTLKSHKRYLGQYSRCLLWERTTKSPTFQTTECPLKNVSQPWISRCIAYIWLVVLFYSCYPVFLMSVIAWYMSKSRKSTHNMLPENERKTILMTGSTSTRGTLCMKNLFLWYSFSVLYKINYKMFIVYIWIWLIVWW